MTAENLVLAVLIGGIAIGCFLVLSPFLPALIWAAILVLIAWPVVEWLTGTLKLPRWLAGLIIVAACAALVVLPIAVAGPRGAEDVNALRHAFEAWITSVPPAPQFLGEIPLIGPQISDTWTHWAADLSSMASFFRPYFGMAAERTLSGLLALAGGVLQLLLALLFAFFLMLSGEQLGAVLQRLVLRVGGEEIGRLLVNATVRTVRGTVYGMVGTAIVQGFLTAFGLALAGVPRAGMLGVVTAFIAVLPIGAPVIWIPASLWLLAEGQTGHGIFLAIYGVVVVSGADHAMRPWLIARGADMPFLLILLGVLGGVIAFGALGLFVGPVLLSLGFALLREFAGIAPGSATQRGSA